MGKTQTVRALLTKQVGAEGEKLLITSLLVVLSILLGCISGYLLWENRLLRRGYTFACDQMLGWKEAAGEFRKMMVEAAETLVNSDVYAEQVLALQQSHRPERIKRVRDLLILLDLLDALTHGSPVLEILRQRHEELSRHGNVFVWFDLRPTGPWVTVENTDEGVPTLKLR